MKHPSYTGSENDTMCLSNIARKESNQMIYIRPSYFHPCCLYTFSVNKKRKKGFPVSPLANFEEESRMSWTNSKWFFEIIPLFKFYFILALTWINHAFLSTANWKIHSFKFNLSTHQIEIINHICFVGCIYSLNKWIYIFLNFC